VRLSSSEALLPLAALAEGLPDMLMRLLLLGAGLAMELNGRAGTGEVGGEDAMMLPRR
jgi:hypothetical protein